MNKEELFELDISMPDPGVYEAAKAVFDGIAKPVDGFGDLEGIICKIAAIHADVHPDISKKALVVMLSDNGVVAEGVSQTGSSVTGAVAALMAEGKSTVGIMTAAMPVRVLPVDVGIDSIDKIPGIIDMRVRRGTGNIAREDAMSIDECIEAINSGIEIVRRCSMDGTGIIATGEMGIGNTTTATALLCALTGSDPEDVTGRGAGLSDEGLKIKTDVIKRALTVHELDKNSVCDLSGGSKEQKSHALSTLASVGGLDIAALTGVFIGCAIYRIPSVIDGLISAVAALTASLIVPGCSRFMIASHNGREKGVGKVLAILGLKPLIDADMALGEGTGAVMLYPVIDMVMNVYNFGTSFKNADIRQYERF